MKLKVHARHALACLAITAAATPAWSQSSVTIYGLIDTTMRYSTAQSADNAHKLQMTDGILTGSRLGYTGIEDLGDGWKVNFWLESGFAPDTGALVGNSLFFRRTTLGIVSPYGTLDIGRQFDLAHDIIAGYDAMAIANAPIQGYQGSYVGGNRTDNTLRYAATAGAFKVGLQHTFGEVTGNVRTKTSDGASLNYNVGEFSFGGVYEVFNDVTNTFFKLATPASKQRTWSVGASWTHAPVKLFATYVDSQLDVADYVDHAIDLGAKFDFTPQLQLTTIAFYDRQYHAGASGTRWTASPLLDYALSKRTDVYVCEDWSKVTGEWRTLASRPDFATPFLGRSTLAQTTIGLRHRF